MLATWLTGGTFNGKPRCVHELLVTVTPHKGAKSKIYISQESFNNPLNVPTPACFLQKIKSG